MNIASMIKTPLGLMAAIQFACAGIAKNGGSRDYWTRDDQEKLERLIQAGCSRAEIRIAFRSRGTGTVDAHLTRTRHAAQT